MRVFLMVLVLAVSGCQAEKCKEKSGDVCLDTDGAETSSLSTASTGSSFGIEVTHCYKSGALPNYDYVIATYPDGSQSISCSVVAGSFVEFTAFSAYSATAAPSANALCQTVDTNGNSVKDWVFSYSGGVATLVADNPAYNATLTCD